MKLRYSPRQEHGQRSPLDSSPSDTFVGPDLFPSDSQGELANALQPAIAFAQGEFALHAVAFFAVANFFVERRKQVEGDIRGLEVSGISVRDVVRQ